jgi:hypothetical protein
MCRSESAARAATLVATLEELRSLELAVKVSSRHLKETVERVATSGQQIDRVDARLADLDRHTNAIEKLLHRIPECGLVWTELCSLLYEAGQSIEMFVQIQEVHRGTTVAEAPFSNSWRRFVGETDPPTEAVRDGTKWMQFLGAHVRHVNIFCLSQDTPILCAGELYTYIEKSRTSHISVSGEQCLAMLRDHYKLIKSLLQDFGHQCVRELDSCARGNASGEARSVSAGAIESNQAL